MIFTIFYLIPLTIVNAFLYLFIRHLTVSGFQEIHIQTKATFLGLHQNSLKYLSDTLRRWGMGRKKSLAGYCYHGSTVRWVEWFGDKRWKTLQIPHITNRKPSNEFDKNMKTRFKKVRITIEEIK